MNNSLEFINPSNVNNGWAFGAVIAVLVFLGLWKGAAGVMAYLKEQLTELKNITLLLETLKTRLEKNDRRTSKNTQHIIELAETYDKEHGTALANKFSKEHIKED